ncbi:hypothetical protein M0813_27531 [Anaeramoeba flamelloides]|uniref:Transmembrane protein n=1 Tax=Anaeramoeba flamelloides TaxID=1746091 RepID=A0AAV7Y9K6_9EUKA|nr:hypothetical protein M0812_28015 [Anaeramoeba flamelloides]KAJ6236786.1 hypothetical protein M0813_27531 [Anaeramoeba flamelloides]
MNALKIIFAGLVGSFCGSFLCLAVSNILIEVTYHDIAGYIFGVIVFLFGVMLFIRTLKISDISLVSRLSVVFLSIVVAFTGVLCAVLNSKWFFLASNSLKTLFYSITSISLSFLFVYCLVQLLNYQIFNCGCCKQENPSAFVVKKSQIYVCICSGVVLGVVNGILFGKFDVENTSKSYHDFHVYQLYMLPIGFFLGLVVGLYSEYIREKVYKDQFVMSSNIDENYFGDETSLINEKNSRLYSEIYNLSEDEDTESD